MVGNYLLIGKSTAGTAAGVDPAKDAFKSASLPAREVAVQPREESAPRGTNEIGLNGRLNHLKACTSPSFEVAAVQMLLKHYAKSDSMVTGIMNPADVTAAVRFPQKYPHAVLAIGKGAQGDLVRDVQVRLKTLGFLEADPTGRIADKTEDAIARFQQSIPELAKQPLGALTIDTLSHLLQRTEWAPKTVASATPASKPNGSRTSVAQGFDHDLLVKMEGGREPKVSTLPPKDFPNSGITLSNGVDLGQWKREDLLKIGVSKELVNKLDKGYLLLKGAKAEEYLAKHPLRITAAESSELYEKVFTKILGQFADTYDRNRGPNAPQFADLPAKLKTAFGSMAYNMGANFAHVDGSDAAAKWKRAIGDQIFAGNHEKVFQMLVANPHTKEGLQNRRFKEAAIVLEHLASKIPEAASRALASAESACAKLEKPRLAQSFRHISNEFRPGLLGNIPESHRSERAEVATTKPKRDDHQATPEHTRSDVHTVRKGETLYAIAKRFHCTIDELKELNHLKGSAISIGQKLRVPDARLVDDGRGREANRSGRV
jgi:hypothetical protein